MNINEKIADLEARLRVFEERFDEMGYSMKGVVQSEMKKKWRTLPQAQAQFGVVTALAVETVDPWKQNRVRYFCPLFHDPNTPVKSLPFAYPVSAMGGFDDCGLNWVPPAGSTLILGFENGHRSTAFYFGTTWHRDRGPDGKHNFGFNIDEYYQLHEGHRKGYLVGANDGSQVFPPWNTESENGFDIDSISDFDDNPEAQRKITPPNIYGFKTPQKHMFKMVDGNYKCNHKCKRIEILSSGGGYMLFKDDHLHDAGTWAHTSCGASGADTSDCTDENGNPKEQTDCEGQNSNSTIQRQGSNIYFKHQNECRPIQGPQTPQNNKVMLPQSGVQIISIAGHTWFADDSVDQPRGSAEWERSIQPFDFGCNNIFKGKTGWISATGHGIVLNDTEEQSQLRGETNGINIDTAAGNYIHISDHTTGEENCPGCPPNKGGSKRGIEMGTTSRHIFEMKDQGVKACSPCRAVGGEPVANADNAYIRLESGYGIQVMIRDDNSQEKTDKQYYQVFCPQRDNKTRGPHLMKFQEKPSGPGQLFFLVGGDYVCSTYDNHFTIVGDSEKNPSDMAVVVSQNTVIDTKQTYFNVADIHAFLATQIILLMAGTKDCMDPKTGDCGPCVWPVLCMSPKGITISDRVFVSASKDAQCASIEQLLPFHECTPWEGCTS